LCHNQSKTTSATGDDSGLVLKRELSKCALEVHSSTTLDNRAARHVLIIGVLDNNALVGTGVFTLLLAGGAFWSFGGRLHKGILLVIFLEAGNCGGEGSEEVSWRRSQRS
jgi:hypothetical protein